LPRKKNTTGAIIRLKLEGEGEERGRERRGEERGNRARLSRVRYTFRVLRFAISLDQNVLRSLNGRTIFSKIIFSKKEIKIKNKNFEHSQKNEL
jgi:hypothetical protein